jgi:hypothetical protein
MNNIDLIRNCVIQYKRPFDAAMVSCMTGVEQEAALGALTSLEQEGLIKRISNCEEIWVRTNRYGNILRKPIYLVNPNPTNAGRILEILQTGDYGSVRSISRVIGFSRQWVYLYLEAMLSVGVVKVEGGYYRLGDESRLHLVGSRQDRGIIGRLKGKGRVRRSRDK